MGEVLYKPTKNRCLFSRVGCTVLIVMSLMSFTSFIVSARRAGRRTGSQIQMKVIWVGLLEYDGHFGKLPPAHLKDSSGRPVLSWRLYAGDYGLYDEATKKLKPPFFSEAPFDTESPWDSPSHSRYRSAYAYAFRSDASRSDETTFTDYVAVLGPDTMWPEGVAVSLKTSNPNAIVILEWPDSNIDWMEPRDVTVSDVLAWCKSDRPGLLGDDLQYVDVSGNCGTISHKTDRETLLRLLSRESIAPAHDTPEKSNSDSKSEGVSDPLSERLP